MDTKLLRDHLLEKILTNPKTGKVYQVTHLLYEGSMAYLYQATDRNLETKVVVKALKYNHQEVEGESIGEMIQRRRKDSHWEHKLLLSIHDALSSAVPQVIDYVQTNSYNPWIQAQAKEWLPEEPYLIMEKLSGKNLAEQSLPLSWEKALDIGHSLSLFFDLIHRQGYVHQSLTPENIILGEDGMNVSIIDFDSVSPLGSSQEIPLNLPPQKKGFLPPEEHFDTRCDLYSLGALLYYLLTGRRPGLEPLDFTASSFTSQPPKVQELVQKCLAPLVSRFATAIQVAQRIEELLGIRKIPVHDYVESPKSFPIRKGTSLNQGAYRVIGGLSSGGQGRIYIAENISMGNRVLIKTPYYGSILGEISEEERLLVVKESHDILEFEKEMLGKFHSESSMVPQPLDFFYDKSYEMPLEIYLPSFTRHVPYLVLEYIQGNTLDRVQKLSGREAFQIGDRLCHIIGCFHEKNYIYQDLKLANIIIDERGQNIYLIDLGSLCLLDEKTGHPDEDMITYGTYTPGYRAPEWIDGPEACDRRSDIYTIGATLWALLSGESPASYFQEWEKILNSRRQAGRIGEITFDHCLYEAESPHLPSQDLQLDPQDEKAGVIQVVRKALEREPSNRYQTVEEVRADIQKVLKILN